MSERIEVDAFDNWASSNSFSQVDRVECGSGFDRIEVDASDVVLPGCEEIDVEET